MSNEEIIKFVLQASKSQLISLQQELHISYELYFAIQRIIDLME